MELQKATDGPLAGFVAVNILQDRFEQFKAYCEGRFEYVWGGKCANLGQFPPTWIDELHGNGACNGCDCSGYARAILDYATNMGTSAMPDGSWGEDEFFNHAGFKVTDYAECANSDGLVRLCVHRPGGRGGDATGHVWLCVNGHTVESCGGQGPFEQPWDTQWYVDHVDDCFVLGPLVPDPSALHSGQPGCE